jgi:hypothetical protein
MLMYGPTFQEQRWWYVTIMTRVWIRGLLLLNQPNMIHIWRFRSKLM